MMGESLRHDIRNLAIIAHVDHGKTTLVDALLKQSHVFREGKEMGELIMDSNVQERERGITILAKNTAIEYKGVTINIIDTPGHADFGGEVERAINMADGCLLLVDAAEGPRPQTRVVLKCALESGLQPILVLNKLDRKNADIKRALGQTEGLLLELAVDESQLDLPVLYVIAKEGRAGRQPEQLEDDMKPLLDAILEHIPCPVMEDGPFQMLVANRGYDKYTGPQAIGRIKRGSLAVGDGLVVMKAEGEVMAARALGLFKYQGLSQVAVQEARAGDIVIVTGLEQVVIGDTLASPENPESLERISVSEPTVQITIGVNTSPLAGREGRFSTSRQLRGRLQEELKTNLSLRVEDTGTADTFLVSGRGELHLAVLIESLRREGYEFEVSRPKVIFKEGKDGRLEPVEHVFIEVGPDYVGAVSGALGKRRGEMMEMRSSGDSVHLDYRLPTRALIGFRNTFLTMTAGTGTMGSLLLGYEPYMGEFSEVRNGALVASTGGAVTNLAIALAQERGEIFVEAGEEVYEGMVIGKQRRVGDMVVNICRQKEQSNVRSSTADIAVKITPVTQLSLEQKLDFLEEDELLEVTPKSLRLHKRYLSEGERRRQKKLKGAALERDS